MGFSCLPCLLVCESYEVTTLSFFRRFQGTDGLGCGPLDFSWGKADAIEQLHIWRISYIIVLIIKHLHNLYMHIISYYDMFCIYISILHYITLYYITFPWLCWNPNRIMVQWCPHLGCRCGRDACINSRLLVLVNAHVVDVVALAGIHWIHGTLIWEVAKNTIPITAAMQNHTENSQQTQGPCLEAVDFVGWLCVPWGELNELIEFYLNSSSGPHTQKKTKGSYGEFQQRS